MTAFRSFTGRAVLQLVLCAVYILTFSWYPLLPATRVSTEVFLWVSGFHSALGLLLAFLWRGNMERPSLLLLLFVLPRLLTFPMQPWLSDDVYRYLWDGLICTQGYNPYAHLPNSAELLHLRGSIYALMDYKHISTLYPPLGQVLFALCIKIGGLFGTSWQAPYFVWKTTLIGCEAVGVYFAGRALRLLSLPLGSLGLYLLLPLPVIEFAGQAHIDGLIIAPLGVLMYLCAQFFGRKQPVDPKSVTRFSFRVGLLAAILFLLKILPVVVILPLLRLRIYRSVLIGTAAALSVLASIPFFYQPEALAQFLAVVRFYSQTAQFNGVPLYALLHLLEFFGVREWWLIAPSVLSVIRTGIVAVCGLAIRAATLHSLFTLMLLSLTAMTFLSSKVHVWYFAPLLLLNSITGWRWLPVFASASLLTYAIYAGPVTKEAYQLEYVLWASAALFAAVEWYLYRDRTKPGAQILLS
jgi:alpha-1,6-mannosyltransferase